MNKLRSLIFLFFLFLAFIWATPEDRQLDFSKTEKEVIENSQKLFIAMTASFPPIDANSIHENESILTGFLDEIASQSGLEFEIRIYQNPNDVLKAIKDGSVSLIAPLQYNSKWAFENNIQLSETLIPLHIYPIINKKSLINHKSEVKFNTIDLDANVKIAITEEFLGTELINSPDKNIILSKSSLESLKAVNKAKADITYTSLYTLQYYSAIDSLKNLVIDRENKYDSSLHIGYAAHLDPRIKDIINKTILSLDDTKRMEIILINVLAFNHDTSLENYVKTNPLESLTLLLSFIGLLAITIILFILMKIHKKKNFALERADSAKTDFLARMSHEIRTPLSAIIGLNDLAIEKTEQNENSKMALSYLNKISISSQHLLELVNNILDISKISDGQMKINKKAFSLNDLLSSLYDLYFFEAQNKNITFTVQNSVKQEDIFIGDSRLLKEVLSNLISNAIKFNKPQGIVTLSITENKTEMQKNAKEKTIRFSVSDSGVGMHRKMLEKIFEPFERDEIWDVKQIRGSGLGLSLSKKMVLLMGSNLNVKSTPGIGSSFWFDIELPISQKQIIQKKSSKVLLNLNGKNVLIAEDDEINAEIIEQILISFSAGKIHRTKNGKECVAAFERSSVGFYDYIIMDIRMPIMDGYAATQIIRKLDRSDAKTTKIIALSANAFEEDKEKSAHVGINYHCAKPLDNDDFIKGLLS